MAKPTRPVHLTVNSIHRDMSKLLKTLAKFSHQTSWGEFDMCRDHLEKVIQSVEKQAAIIKKEAGDEFRT